MFWLSQNTYSFTCKLYCTHYGNDFVFKLGAIYLHVWTECYITQLRFSNSGVKISLTTLHGIRTTVAFVRIDHVYLSRAAILVDHHNSAVKRNDSREQLSVLLLVDFIVVLLNERVFLHQVFFYEPVHILVK